jgi:hypothetical protein
LQERLLPKDIIIHSQRFGVLTDLRARIDVSIRSRRPETTELLAKLVLNQKTTSQKPPIGSKVQSWTMQAGRVPGTKELDELRIRTPSDVPSYILSTNQPADKCTS